MTRCRCGKLASTKRPCKSCGNRWPMKHCHNRLHMNHVRKFTAIGTLLWPIDYARQELPFTVEDIFTGEQVENPDLNPCFHVHPHDDYEHWNEPHHQVRHAHRLEPLVEQ